MSQLSGSGTDGKQRASAWGVGVATAVASASPADFAAASAFHRLLGRLCDEHEKLQQEAAALAEENRALRSRIPQQDGGSSGDGADKVLSAGHEVRPAPTDKPEADAHPFPSREPSLPQPSFLQASSTSFEAAGHKVNPAPTDEPEADARPLPLCEPSLLQASTKSLGATRTSTGKLDEERLSACVRRIQAAFQLEDWRMGICIQEVLDLLRESPAYEAGSDKLVEELFDQLGAAPPRSGQGSSRPTLTRSWSRSFATRKLSKDDIVDTREVALMKFAELMLAKELTDLLPDSRPEHMKVLRVIRHQVFHQDSRGIIPADITHLNMIGLATKGDLFNRYLDLVVNAAIVANAIAVGWFAGSNTVGWGPPQIADLVFTLIFAAEMLVKILRSGLRRHFRGPERAWNVFDAALVCLGLVDFVMTMAAAANSSAFNPSSLMALRIIRMSRLLRMARLAAFRELQLMVNGIVGMLKTLSCAFALVFLIVYFLGICLVQVLGLRDGDTGEVVVEQAMLFEGVTRSMFTVFRCLMTGDCTTANGTPVALHLSEAFGWPYALAYSICCVLVNYGIGSLITALVVDTTLNEAKKTEFKNALKETHQRTLAMRLRYICLLFEQEQLKQDGLQHRAGYGPSMLFLGKQAFLNTCERQDVKEVLDLLDIDEADRADLFDAIDADGNGYLEMDELVEGLTKMGGKARKADGVAARLKLSTLLRRVEQTHTETQEAHGRILQRLEELHSLGSDSPAGAPTERREAGEASASGAEGGTAGPAAP